MIFSAFFSPHAGLDKFNQFFRVIKFIVVAVDSFSVIDNAVFFIAFKAVEQFFNSVAFYKKCERVRLDFCKKPFFAVGGALIAALNVFCRRTVSVFAPFFVRAFA